MDVADLLTGRLGGASIEAVERLSGGASRDTWRFRADGRPLVLQRQRPSDARDMLVEAGVVRAAGESGVPVPALVDAGRDDDGAAFMILAAVDGETIPRKIQRDDRFAAARRGLVGELGRALARIHEIDPASTPNLPASDQIAQYTEVLDALGEPHPVLELVRRWLLEHRRDVDDERAVERAVVHGDFRLGNVIVDERGLQAVIDWELAHLGDPMEDLGWLCVRAWRFGGTQPVAGLGDYDELFAAYEQAGGRIVDREAVHWWQVLGTWKWGIMCILQANVHLSGAARSHELATIGRRVCENEYDLLRLLDGASEVVG